MMYKLYKTLDGKDAVMTVGVDPQSSFLFDENNPDYQAFLKYQEEGGKVYGADEEVPVNG